MPLKLVNIKTPNNEEMFQLQENVNQISYQFFWWQFLGGGGGNFSWVHLCLGGVTVPHPEEIWGQKVLTGMLYTSYNKMSNALILV